jgi:two-component system nitrogen regulation sensor histidine kinase GlnL
MAKSSLRLPTGRASGFPCQAAATAEHLFDPFVTTKTSGTGLGLALVAKIIGDHGGIVECESLPRKTIFRVLLPMHTGASVIQNDKARSARLATGAADA